MATQKSVTLIGFGNWGTALALALRSAGIPIREIVLRASRARTLAIADRKLIKSLGAKHIDLAHSKFNADLVWICTPDAAIPAVAQQMAARLAKLNRPARAPWTAFHSSGVWDSQLLAPLRTVGASIASVHPLMTFPGHSVIVNAQSGRISPNKNDRPSLTGVPFAGEGDLSACRLARTIVKNMRGEFFHIRARQKPLYHAFCTLASPLLIAQLTATLEAAVSAGFNNRQARGLMRPIAEQTLSNFFQNGPDHSFSGPLARGDVATIHRHLNALQSQPELASVYAQLSRYALDVLPVKNKARMRSLLRKMGYDMT